MIKQMLKALILRIFSRSGAKAIVIDTDTWDPYFQADELMSLYQEGLVRSGVEWSDNYYKQLRYYSLQQMVHYVIQQGLHGDFVECGVWKGHSAYIISKILSENGFTERFNIFDAFEGGLSDKHQEDDNPRFTLTEEEIQEESSIFSSTETEVRSCLSDVDFVHLYNGWIPDRFGEIKDRNVSFLHLDVDLYEPTRDSLEFFYPKLVDNGVVVCDDYGATQFPGAKKAVDEFLEKSKYKLLYKVPMGSCIIIK